MLGVILRLLDLSADFRTHVLLEGRNVMKNQALTKTTFIQNNRRSIPRPIAGLIFSTCYLFNIIHNLLM